MSCVTKLIKPILISVDLSLDFLYLKKEPTTQRNKTQDRRRNFKKVGQSGKVEHSVQCYSVD